MYGSPGEKNAPFFSFKLSTYCMWMPKYNPTNYIWGDQQSIFYLLSLYKSIFPKFSLNASFTISCWVALSQYSTSLQFLKSCNNLFKLTGRGCTSVKPARSCRRRQCNIDDTKISKLPTTNTYLQLKNC